jgi:AcrR family transcriptional regulator
MARTYRMRARAESAAETRRRVIESARAAIVDGPTPSLSMADVAARAGVARSTLYDTFGSRGGLVGAVLVEVSLRAGFERVLELFNLPDAAQGIRQALPAGVRMIGSDYELLRRVGLLAQLDPDVRVALDISAQQRAGGMRYQAERLAEQRRLRPGVTVDEAAALLWVLTDFRTYDGLRSMWGMDVERIAAFVESVGVRYLLVGEPG